MTVKRTGNGYFTISFTIRHLKEQLKNRYSRIQFRVSVDFPYGYL